MLRISYLSGYMTERKVTEERVFAISNVHVRG